MPSVSPRCLQAGQLGFQLRDARLVVGDLLLDLVGAIGHLVEDWFGLGPEEGERPEQAPEYQGQHAQHVDRILLRMTVLLGNFLRKDVHHPEQVDAPDRHADQHEPRDGLGHSVEGFAGEEGSLGEAGKEQKGEQQRCQALGCKHDEPRDLEQGQATDDTENWAGMRRPR
jgi:hypothetical protein